MIACSKIGAIANFINPLFATEQMVKRINDTKSKLLFVMDEMLSYIVDAVPHTCIEKTVIMPVTESMSKLAKLVVCAEQKNRNKKRTDPTGQPKAGKKRGEKRKRNDRLFRTFQAPERKYAPSHPDEGCLVPV